MTKVTTIKLFEEKQDPGIGDTRQEKWYNSIVDRIELLAGTERARNYWSELITKLKKEVSEWLEKIGQLKIHYSDRKFYPIDAGSTEQFFRLIQSIHSPKAEQIKLWLLK
jgi:hypothetical protein